MKIRQFKASDEKKLVHLIGEYRIDLAELKGSKREIDLKAAQEEFEFYKNKEYPIFVTEEKGKLLGFHVCKIQDEIIWSESLYVIPEARRKGIASALYEEAEKIAVEIGCDTVYNWVHPNNYRSIPFLKKRGYTVLNLIEVCKRRPRETIAQKIKVGKYEFDY